MAHLAIHGGSSLRERDFPSWPVFDEREVEAVTRVVRSGRWWRYSFGEGVDWHEPEGGERANTALFQEEFARFQGARYGVACVNGTAGLDILVRALGIGPGMEVIVPAYTYIATATCVLQSGAMPVFADIDPETYNIDPARAEQAVTGRTAAIIPCHFGGQVADMERLTALAGRHGLAIIEDAAHAHGSTWNGRGAGTMGAGGMFSFQSAKNMTAGEGGIVITDDGDLAHRMESLTWSGRRPGRPWYEFHELGWNYRMTEFQAALLRVQLTRVGEQNRRRRENAAYLTGRLAEIKGLEPVVIDPRAAECSVHIYMIRYDAGAWRGLSRARLLDAMNAEGIPTFSGYTYPLYRNPMFTDRGSDPSDAPVPAGFMGNDVDYRKFGDLCPVSERACAGEAIWLEHRLFLGDRRDMDDIADGFIKIRENLRHLV